MTNQGLIPGAMLYVSLFVGCSGSAMLDDAEFRASPGLEETDPSYAGNGDITIRSSSSDDDDDDLPDIIIWDIDGGSVTRQTEPGVFEERILVEGTELIQVSEDPAAASTPPGCSGITGDHPSGQEFKLVDATGAVVLTLWKRYVFLGDVDVPAASGGGGHEALVDLVAFSFKQERIYAGHWSNGEVVAIASEQVAIASPMRRLTLSALVTGECGSNGLP